MKDALRPYLPLGCLHRSGLKTFPENGWKEGITLCFKSVHVVLKKVLETKNLWCPLSSFF
jgi:hypothetical protein